jgi:hypothetical protein
MINFLSKCFAFIMFVILGLVFWVLMLQPAIVGHY